MPHSINLTLTSFIAQYEEAYSSKPVSRRQLIDLIRRWHDEGKLKNAVSIPGSPYPTLIHKPDVLVSLILARPLSGTTNTPAQHAARVANGHLGGRPLGSKGGGRPKGKKDSGSRKKRGLTRELSEQIAAERKSQKTEDSG